MSKENFVVSISSLLHIVVKLIKADFFLFATSVTALSFPLKKANRCFYTSHYTLFLENVNYNNSNMTFKIKPHFI